MAKIKNHVTVDSHGPYSRARVAGKWASGQVDKGADENRRDGLKVEIKEPPV